MLGNEQQLCNNQANELLSRQTTPIFPGVCVDKTDYQNHLKEIIKRTKALKLIRANTAPTKNILI